MTQNNGRPRNLTLRYGLHQMLYWVMYAGIFSFATTYLLEKGFSAAQIGIILACANFSSGALQPLLAGFADRFRRPILPLLISSLAALSFLCFAAILLLAPPLPIFALLYLIGALAYDIIVPLMNSVNVYYNARGFSINYGVGRGVGSLAFSMASLCLGYVIRYFGPDWMIGSVLGLIVLFIAVTLSYPKTAGEYSGRTEQENTAPDNTPFLQFFRRYRWYCFSLAGVLFLAMFHAMTENYLIETMRRMGGDSGNVGMALAIATSTATPVLLFFDRIQKRLSSSRILKIAGAMFTVKALLFLIAPSIESIYVIELLQMVTYAFLSPVQMYYARERVSAADMVKGQAFITASYTIGCALGNLIGGQIIAFSGVTAMLAAGIVMAALGTVILFVSSGQTDIPAALIS